MYCLIIIENKLNYHGMLCFLVFVIVCFPLGLIITVVTLQNSVTVLCCYVILKNILSCSLIITLMTEILFTFM